MTDKEIGKVLGAIQETICKRRLSSLLQLRKLAEENLNAGWIIMNGNRIQVKRKNN